MATSAHELRQAAPFARSNCAVASTLDIVGDKWSLLVIRDLFAGKSTYGELLAVAERMPTNILADRLRRLEEAGIIEKTAYQERPVRFAYTLTPKGREMGEILIAIVRWGQEAHRGHAALDIATRGSGAARRRRRKRRRRASKRRV